MEEINYKDDSKSFFQENIKKENSFLKSIKKLSLVTIYIFSCFILGLIISFSIIIFKDIVIPNFANNSIQKFNNTNNEENLNIQNVSNNLSSVIENVKPSIVSITTLTRTQDFLNNPINKEDSGSGIIFHKTATDVYIVTNNSIVDDVDNVAIVIQDKKPIFAKLVAKNENNNLAIISVPMKEVNKLGIYDVKVARFGSSSSILEGDYVIAIGNAIGEGNTATFGMISAKSREIVVNNRKLNVLQTTAAINPGNNGGALINLNGEVIGINVAKVVDSSVEGIGYSISTDIAMPLIEEMMNNTNPATLGVEIVDASAYPNTKYKVGALVVNIIKNGSAHKAGVLPYDIITSVNNSPILNSAQLIKEIKKYSPKDIIKLNIIRNGEVINLKVKLLKPNI